MSRAEYISTRGRAPTLDFEQALLAGLADDGGLYVPRDIPKFSPGQVREMAQCGYAELAMRLLRDFVGGGIPSSKLNVLLEEAYGSFRDQRGGHDARDEIAPLVQTGEGEWVLELFHGPTLAFKDFAMQLLGPLLDYALQREERKAVVLGATSGDTGSAAIEGCRRCRNLDMFILHPHQRISEVQRRQMTTAAGENIHNIALEGSFDDCQAIVKSIFADRGFRQRHLRKRSLIAVNSINWARIMAQIAYYFHAALSLVRMGVFNQPHALSHAQKANGGELGFQIAFAVPTGNFGDILAGYYARRMGLPVAQLIIAANRNDFLHQLLSQGACELQAVRPTLSPSMDISVPSNFERILFELFRRDSAAVAEWMRRLSENGEAALQPDALGRLRRVFSSHSTDDEQTRTVIAEVYKESGYLLDPHSAVGLSAARACRRDKNIPIISLATAHPAKFPEAIAAAIPGMQPETPPALAELRGREERYDVLPRDLKAVQAYIAERIT